MSLTQETIQFAIQLATLIGIIFAIYKVFRDPDIKAGKAIQDLTAQQKAIDACIADMKDDFKLLKENHIAHIERDINSLNIQMTRIETTLNERLPKK
jgi:hypothetical protein